MVDLVHGTPGEGQDGAVAAVAPDAGPRPSFVIQSVEPHGEGLALLLYGVEHLAHRAEVVPALLREDVPVEWDELRAVVLDDSDDALVVPTDAVGRVADVLDHRPGIGRRTPPRRLGASA